MSTFAAGTQPSRRSPHIAALLGFLWPGIGYLYSGRGMLGFLLLLLLPLAELGMALLAVLIPVPLACVAIPVALVFGLRLLLAVGAARAARAFPPDRPVPWFGRWYSCVAALLLSACPGSLWAHAYRTSFVQAFKIPSGGMEPTLLIGDYLLTVNWAYGWRDPVFGRLLSNPRPPQRGELVAFRYPEDPSRAFLKRCIGLPGDVVEVRGRTVSIGGKALHEPYARHLAGPFPPGSGPHVPDGRGNWGPQVVPAGHYFVLGDNRDNSRDSRFWGFLPQDHLIGRATVVYWSYEASREEYATTSTEWIKDTLSAFVRTRWARIGHRLE